MYISRCVTPKNNRVTSGNIFGPKHIQSVYDCALSGGR